MSAFFELVKVDLQGTFDKRKFKENKKAQTFLAFVLIFAIIFICVSFLYNFIYVNMFKLANLDPYMPAIFFAAFASIFTFSTSLFKIKGIFIGKDYDMLSAMPIKKSHILGSKLFSLYIVEFLYSAIIMVPNAIVILIAYHNILAALTSLLMLILLPAIPMVIALLFSLFATLVADRYKFGNLINVILYMILFAAIFFLSFSLSFSSSAGGRAIEGGEIEALAKSYTSLYNTIKYMNPSLLLVELAYTKNPLFILLFVLGNILLVLLVIFLIAKLFGLVHQVINTYKSNTVYVKKELAVKGQFSTLFKAESKKYFGSKYYFINTVSSGICAIIFSVLISLSLSSKVNLMSMDPTLFDNIKPFLYFVSFGIVFGVGIQTPAAISISIEGNGFWITKSLPINYKKYLFSKVLLSSLVLGFCSIIGSTIMVSLISLDIFSIITIYLLPLLFIVFASELGLVIDLKHYKFDWKNEMDCVKHSSASYIALFSDWGVMLLLAGGMIGFAFISTLASQIFGISIILLALILLSTYIYKNADKLIERIEF